MPANNSFNRFRRNKNVIKDIKKESALPILAQWIGLGFTIITTLAALYLGCGSYKLQQKANEIASNDSIQRAQIGRLTTIVDKLENANAQGLELNRQVVELVEEARNQSRISLLSDEPQIDIVNPVVSYVKAIPNEDSSQVSDAATFNQTIVFKNYGRRKAILKAVYVYLFKIQQSTFDNDKLKHQESSSEISTIANASTGSIDLTINYREISPGDTLGYSFSTYIQGYWNADDLINDYEVVKIIYQDPLGKEIPEKFYFQYDSNASVNPNIPKSIKNALDSLTKKPPTTSKGSLDPFVGIIRPNR